MNQTDNKTPRKQVAVIGGGVAGIVAAHLLQKTHDVTLLEQGDYLPLKVSGEHAAHVCAYARRHGQRAIVVVVPLLPVRLLGDNRVLPLGKEVWADTVLELPDGLASAGWRNLLSGESHSAGGQLAIGAILASFPVALLTTGGEP